MLAGEPDEDAGAVLGKGMEVEAAQISPVKLIKLGRGENGERALAQARDRLKANAPKHIHVSTLGCYYRSACGWRSFYR